MRGVVGAWACRWRWRWWCCAVPSSHCVPGMQRHVRPPAGKPFRVRCGRWMEGNACTTPLILNHTSQSAVLQPLIVWAPAWSMPLQDATAVQRTKTDAAVFFSLPSWFVSVMFCVVIAAAAANGVGCRERCGGQGYLSVNRFGELIGFAHAGMTAEGDNR